MLSFDVDRLDDRGSSQNKRFPIRVTRYSKNGFSV